MSKMSIDFCDGNKVTIAHSAQEPLLNARLLVFRAEIEDWKTLGVPRISVFQTFTVRDVGVRGAFPSLDEYFRYLEYSTSEYVGRVVGMSSNRW